MNRIHYIARTAFFLLVAFGVADLSLAAGRDARILGTVVDENGERLEGVAVVIAREEGDETTATTNRKGRFSVILADGTVPYTITLSKDGYQDFQEPFMPKVGQALTKTWTLVEGSSGPRTTAEAAEGYRVGTEALRAGDPAAAKEALLAAVAADPQFIPAQQALVLAHLNLGDWDSATAVAGQLLAVNAEDTLALKGAFDAAHEAGRHDEARGYLDRLLALEQSVEVAQRIYNEAIYQAQKGDAELGREMLNQAIEMQPEMGEAYLALSAVHLEAEQYDEALAVADRLLAFDEGNADALSIRYEVFRRTGDKENYEAALQALQQADPKAIADAFFQQGSMLYEENQLEAAQSAFERVLAAAPDDPRTHLMLGRVLTSKGDYQAAVSHLQRFVELAPDDPEAADAREFIEQLQ